MGLSERIEYERDMADTAQGGAGAGGQGAATRTLRVMSYNILAGGWPRVDALEAVMRDTRADVIGLQEVEPRTLAELAQRLEMYSALSPSRRGSPVGLLSRWPLREVNPHADAPLANALLEAVVLPANAPPLRIFVAHLSASYEAWRAGEGQRLRELAYILDRMRQTRDVAPGEERLLMGDFNSLPPGERLLASRLLLHTAQNDARRAQGADLTGLPGVAKVLPPPLRPLGSALLRLLRLPPLAWACDQVAGRYVPRAVVRRTVAAGYRDLYAVACPDPAQRELSCPALNPAGRIDYIFASAGLGARLTACELLGDTPGRPVTLASDHRPMLATLALPGAQE